MTRRHTSMCAVARRACRLAAVWAWAAAMSLALTACGGGEPRGERFVIDRLNGYTPVKCQGSDNTCWAYAMLAAMETTHISMGDSVHLSVDYAVRGTLADRFDRCYLARGAWPMSDRGTGHTLLRSMARHGMVAHDAYRAPATHSAAALARRARHMAEASATACASLGAARRRMVAMLDHAMGPVPRRVYMLGAEYTPQEFARSVCAPGEYVAMTSFTHHPFGEDVALQLPDGDVGDLYRNVPLDTLMGAMVEAVEAGRGVCWEGDVTEEGFSFAQGVARLPAHADTSQEARQRAFERFLTTDDHCMAIVGLAHDGQGRRYFVMKNSWGTGNPYGGLMYVSLEYARLKTIAAYVARER